MVKLAQFRDPISATIVDPDRGIDMWPALPSSPPQGRIGAVLCRVGALYIHSETHSATAAGQTGSPHRGGNRVV
jgi:hypothetical protein